MNKSDLINSIYQNSGVSKVDTTKVVDGVFSTITDQLSSGGECRFVGFGTFSVSNRKATIGRNPQTGATIQIPASKQARFKVGKTLKDAVRG